MWCVQTVAVAQIEPLQVEDLVTPQLVRFTPAKLSPAVSHFTRVPVPTAYVFGLVDVLSRSEGECILSSPRSSP